MTALLSLLLMNTAAATELTASISSDYNDPFVERTLFSLGGALDIAPGARLALRSGYAPDLGENDWRGLTSQLVEDSHVSPDISKLIRSSSLSMVVEPYRGPIGSLGSAMAMYAGVGVVFTQDDLDALGVDKTDKKAFSTYEQRHPSAVWGVIGDIYITPAFGLRWRWDHIHYVETVNATTLESKHVAQNGLEFVFVLDEKNRDAVRGDR